MAEHWIVTDAGALHEGDQVQLDPSEGRHLTSVLRLGIGDTIVLSNGRGTVAAAVIEVRDHHRVTVRIRTAAHHPEPPGRITVALGILHSQAMDWAVTKAVETGAVRFIPVVTARSQGDRAAARRRLPRWRRIARQAIKQCHRAWEMDVAEPLHLDDLMASVPGGSGVVADREGLVAWRLGVRPGTIFLVGPEGGLTGPERDGLDRAGWRRMTLGPHVLRAETAVTAGTAIVSLAVTLRS